MHNTINHNAFERDLAAAKSLDQLNTLLKQTLRQLNIKHYSFTYYAVARNAKKKYRYDMASDSFKLWHQHYLSETYETIDNTHQQIRYNTLPYYWNCQQQLREAKSPLERQLRLDSLAYGIECGVCVPMHGNNNEFANFLVAQMQGENCLSNWPTIQHDLFLIAHYYFQHCRRLLVEQNPKTPSFLLSSREKQCLTLTGQQYTVSAIAKQLHITERTVNYHIQKANKALGTANKYQSVEKALNQGLIVL